MTNITKKTLIAAGVIAALGITATTSAFAADVPAGVQLADKQEIVKNNGSEVQSLDPHKIEGVPENNVTRDLMEGRRTTARTVPSCRASRKAGITRISKSGPSTCVKTQNGPMASR